MNDGIYVCIQESLLLIEILLSFLIFETRHMRRNTDEPQCRSTLRPDRIIKLASRVESVVIEVVCFPTEILWRVEEEGPSRFLCEPISTAPFENKICSFEWTSVTRRIRRITSLFQPPHSLRRLYNRVVSWKGSMIGKCLDGWRFLYVKQRRWKHYREVFEASDVRYFFIRVINFL